MRKENGIIDELANVIAQSCRVDLHMFKKYLNS